MFSSLQSPRQFLKTSQAFVAAKVISEADTHRLMGKCKAIARYAPALKLHT